MGLRFTSLFLVLFLSALALACAATPGGPTGSGTWTSIAQAPGAPGANFTTPPRASTSITTLPAPTAPTAPATEPAVEAPPAVLPQPQQPAVETPPVPALEKPATPPADDFTFRFSVGDEVNVDIWREKELSATHTVLRDGTISPPLLDPVRIEGMTIKEVRSALLPRYKKYIKDPRISVRVVKVHSSRVYVLGEVGDASAVVATGRTTALQAIAQAGGFEMANADRERVRVVRVVGGKAQVRTVNAAAVIAGRQRDIVLRPDDVVFVPAKGVTDWSRNLSQALAPIGELLGSVGAIATTIVAIDSLND